MERLSHWVPGVDPGRLAQALRDRGYSLTCAANYLLDLPP